MTAIISTIFSQLGTLFWKQKCSLRADLPSLIPTLLLPSVLILLAATNSATNFSSDSIELVECKIDNFLYCNYPMEVRNVDEDAAAILQVVGSNVAETLGSDYDSLFGEIIDPTTKEGGEILMPNSTTATASWFNGKNPGFAERFTSLCNEELIALGSDIRFEAVKNPYAWEGEGGNAFDLRIGTFILLLQAVGGQITSETSSNLYVYFTRAGLLPSVFWLYQYTYWMIIGSISIGITAIVGFIADRNIQVGAYFVAAWFHITIAVFFSSIFKNKKALNFLSFGLLITGFAIPIVFMSINPTEQNEKIYDGFKCIPVFYFTGDVKTSAMNVGCIVSAILMVLAAYLAPLLAGASDGMYAGSKVNYFYFLSPKFWKSGIVALPSYEDEVSNPDDLTETGNGGGEGLVYTNCVKRFGDEKVIGPLSVQLEPGHITTLLGPNGVGKSTLMRVAAGYYIPSEGEMILNGTNTFRESPHECLKSISFCPQDNYLYESLTVAEHLMFMSSLRDMSAVDDIGEHIDWILQTLDIFDKKSTLAKNLSGGMKRRLCLALATIGFPPVILCDEPSSGVDSMNQRGIWKLLETMKKKSAILLTSHSALEAVILSDSVVMMKSSEDIIQTKGVEGIAFSVKDEVENSTREYEVNGGNVEELANTIASIPNDGSEWKIASKRLTVDALPPLKDVLNTSSDNNEDSDEAGLLLNEVPETLNCEAPSMWRQVAIIMSTLLLHPDRLFFILVFGGGINGVQIWLATQYEGWGDIAQIILTPLMPTIVFILPTIIIVQLTEIFAGERSLGVTKLFMSQGISRFPYLLAYVIFFFLCAFPVSLSLLMTVGSVYGTSLGLFCIFIIFSSFIFMLVGFSCALGALLEHKTAFVMTIILPSLFAIFAQGATNASFHNSYPGANGQVIAGLLIDDIDTTEWGLFAVCIVINILIGSFSFWVWMTKMGNYNPFANMCSRDKSVETIKDVDYDVENYNTQDTNIFLEGKNIDKIYGVGEKEKASFKALDNVTFAVENGSLLGLVGKSGAGKSTLMDILSGQLSVSSGAVYVEGSKVVPVDISKVVSMCGQLDTMWPKLKVSTVITIFMLCRGYKGVSYFSDEIKDPYISYLIRELGMEEMLKKKVEKLSGGQKRRLAFLMSLMGKTKVVLVDEAMTGVDIESRQIMWKILQNEVRLRDRSVVVTSHDMGEVEQYCNTVGILHQGKLVEMGELDVIKKKWGDSIKLICLFSSRNAVTTVHDVISTNHPSIVIDSPLIDVLCDKEETRIVATYAINLIDLKNIAGLIYTLDEGISDPSMLYWSIEPQSLDDFVRSKATSEVREGSFS